MEATIPTGDATDSDFGAFADAEKARAARHYTAMAVEAEALFDVRKPQTWESYAAAADCGDFSVFVAATRNGNVTVSASNGSITTSITITRTQARALAGALVAAARS